MKNLILSFVILTASLNSVGQEINELHYLNANQINGIYQLGSEAAVLSMSEYRSIDKQDVYQLTYLSNHMATLEINIPENSQLVDVESNPEFSVLIFQTRNREQIVLVYISQDQTISYNTYSGEADYRSGGIEKTALNSIGNLVVVRHYSEMGIDAKGKTIVLEYGKEILNFDNTGNLKGRRLEKREGTVWSSIIGITPIPEGSVFMYELNDYKNKEYHLEVRICDNIGNIIGSHILTENGGYFPSDIISDNGKIILSGYYVKGSVFAARKTEGLFITMLNMDGSLQTMSTFGWDNLKSKLKDAKRSDFIFTGKMKVMVEKIEATNSGYKILCESYSSGGGTTTAEFLLGGNSTANQHVITVYDFVVFETDKSGELTSVNILPKEESNIDMGGVSKKTGSMEVSNLIKKYDVFPFKSYRDGKIIFVRYKNKVPFYAEMDVRTGAITEGGKITFEPVIEEKVDKDWEAAKSNSGMLNRLDKLSAKTEKFEKNVEKVGNKLEYGLEKIDRKFSPYGKSNAGYYMLSNKVVSYLINPDTYSVFYQYIN